MFGQYHTNTIIFVSKDSSYYGTDDFRRNVKWGNVQYATLGAGNGGNKLKSDVNRDKDIILDIKANMHWLYSGTGNVAKLFAAENHYAENHYENNNNTLNYDLFPNPNRTTGWLIGKGYNSNSFTAGILQALGISAPTPVHSVPGWNKPVPKSYFGY